MGDPNHSGYQFVGKVQEAVDSPVQVIPGVSSLQVAASRARTPMEETVFVTLHKSGDITLELQRLHENAGERHLLVLPRPYDWMPADIAADLVEGGAPRSLDALVLERLTHADEETTRTTLGDLSTFTAETNGDESVFSDLSVLAVRSA
jgi:cobalt-precorrin-7 (C5)-methyltransferase